MDPAAALAAIGERTAAILPVHLFGIPAETGSLSVMARQHGVALVEDAAQAHGARSHGRRVGSGDSIATWSFYPGKNLGALGDGGAVTTSDRELAGRVARLGNYGSSAKYVHEELGCNSRLDDIQAAALSVRLAHLDDWNRRRAVVAAAYLEGLCDLDWLRLPKSPDWADPAWHLYVVRCVSRDRLRAHLASAGVECLVHYPTPPHLQSAYASLGFGVGAFPVAERFARESLSLPMGPHLRASQVDRVIDAIRSFRP
jgi:dTDP-3-amino-3,4,6-trideoxy-alpha-D-glucose transaminase